MWNQYLPKTTFRVHTLAKHKISGISLNLKCLKRRIAHYFRVTVPTMVDLYINTAASPTAINF